VTTTATVPRRHRRDHREAIRNRDEQLDVLARQVEIELAQRPAAPAKERVSWRDRERLPVARPVMTNPRDEIGWFVGHVRNRAGHHFFRLDLHALAFWCSAGRGTHRGCCWLRDYVKMPARQEVLIRAMASGETEKHARLSASYEKRKKLRKQKLAGAGGAVVVGFLLMLAMLGAWPTVAALALAGPPALAIYGRQRGPKANPVMQIDTRPIPKAEGRPSPLMIHNAFAEAGIDGIDCETAPHRVGPGWETVIRIPVGKQTFADAVKVHGTIAGNLGIGSECLFLSPVRGHGGSEKHVRVWHTKVDPFAGDPPPHPLLDPRSGPADLWNSGLPIGLDARGSVARIAVVDTPAIAVIGQPGAGKTFLIFGAGIGIAADPTWDSDCWSFKDSDDYAPLKPLVKACGGTYDYGSDAKTFDRFVRYLTRLIVEVRERNEALGQLPIDQNPKAKVERDLAAARGSRFRPRLIICDEIITAIEGDDRVLPLLEELNRIIRSQNFVFLFGAQFADATSTFGKLQRLIGATVCLSVNRWQDSKGALGSDHVPGMSEADKIPLTAKGVAIVAGAIEDPEIGSRPAFKIRTFRTDRRLLADHVARQLAGPRAGQTKLSLVKTTDDDPFRTDLADALADGPAGIAVLAQALGFGEGTGATREFTKAVRAAGIEPRTETRDTGGVVARGAKYIDPEQLDSH
jgi:hypothetical protein